MAISEAFTGTATISSTEYSLVSNSTTLASNTDDGVYQVFVDFGNMAAGDEYEVVVKEKVIAASTQDIVFKANVVGVQGSPAWVTPSLIFMHGWDVTVKKIAGTDRSISWSIRKVA